ncbi:unnamed protein product [Coccothraustes coccothraustes]
MEGAALANEEAALPAGANGSKDAGEAAANQQRGDGPAAANEDAPLHEMANEGKRSCGSANQDKETPEVTNDSKEPQAANEDRGCKPSTSEITACKAPANEDSKQKASTNQDSGHKSPASQDTAPLSTNQNTAPQPNERQAPPLQDPIYDLTPLAAAANQAQDPWDWSLEEAWLRAPEEEGLEAWGAELEGWEVEPDDDEEEELDDWEGAELRPKWADPPALEAGHWLPSPDGAWSKLTVRPGRGLARPGPGSLCRVRLSVRHGRGALPAAGSGRGGWRSVRLGSAEGRWARLLDAGLETMAAGELAWLRPRAAPGRALGVRLGRFTPAPAFWAVPPSLRRPPGPAGLARASHLLRRGRAGAAAEAYRRALRAAIAAAGPPPLPAERAALKAELHAGLATAQLRLGIPAAAAANAGKALELRPAHLGARYARGVARAAMLDLEAAREDLLAVLRARPGHAGAARELGRVRDKARERDTQLATRLGKMFA